MKAERATPIFVEAIGFAAPGMATWQAAQSILSGEHAYVPDALPPHAPALLPPNERRRATPTVRLAFQAAEDAVTATGIAPNTLATVFASSDADLAIIHRICLALAATPRVVSPTDFHNSVHNASAGYWSIAVGARAPSSTLSAHDYSFAVGLMEACASVVIDARDTLLVAFDLPPPEPLFHKRPIAHPVGAALVLTRQRTERSLATLVCGMKSGPETRMSDAALEALRLGNPAARALPLLRQLSIRESGEIFLPRSRESHLGVTLRML